MKDNLVVISGGGLHQIENGIGALMALYNAGRVNLFDRDRTDYRVCSAGAVCAGAMMAGLKPDQLLSRIKESPVDKLIHRRWFWPINLVFGNRSIYNRTGFETLLREVCGDCIFPNMTVSVTKVDGLVHQFMDGSYDVILASTSIGKIFPSVVINGVEYMDGGYTDNVPVTDWKIDEYPHTYIILYPEDLNKEKHELTVIGRLLREFDTKLSQEVNEAGRVYSDKMHYPSVTVLRPPPHAGSLLSWSDNFEMVDFSYANAVETLKREGLWQ